uniref:Uncharacterized protein n=1 Tax=Anguilla anguilla TaxID=7936 RepID=A0A0E9RM38_ANGAN
MKRIYAMKIYSKSNS